jgi:hypothetical protein
MFPDLMAHLRGCGWRCPFILQGNRIRPIGIVGPKGIPRAKNDNRARGMTS